MPTRTFDLEVPISSQSSITFKISQIDTRYGTILIVQDVGTDHKVTDYVEKIATMLRRSGIYWDSFIEYHNYKGQPRPHRSRIESFHTVTFYWDGDTAHDPEWLDVPGDQVARLKRRLF